MNVHGEKGATRRQSPTGEFGVLSKLEIECLIQSHDPSVSDIDAGRLAEWIMGHDGHGGDGGTTLTYQSKQVFHKTALGGGATVFIYEAVDGTNIAGICGIGQHRNKSGTHTYDLNWRKHNWAAPMITL
jgi:hypothetical protein